MQDDLKRKGNKKKKGGGGAFFFHESRFTHKIIQVKKVFALDMNISYYLSEKLVRHLLTFLSLAFC